MDFRNILRDIEKTDPEVYEQLSPRRNMLKSFGAKVAVAALPFAVGSLFQKASAKTTSSAMIDALNFMLELEYMEYALFRTATNTGGLIPSGDLPGFQAIQAHELAHINFLITTITNMGGTPFTPNHYTDPTTEGQYVPAAYDFTANGTYHTFDDYASFLIVSSVIEDTVIRAYNGLVNTFVGNGFFVQLQQLLATEGRHASFIRLIRRNAPVSAPEIPAPWINNNIPPTVAWQSFYLGEDNTVQKDVSITSLKGVNGYIPELSATAAFDEPLAKATVLSLLSPFILS
jgi:Ferritin-like domain